MERKDDRLSANHTNKNSECKWPNALITWQDLSDSTKCKGQHMQPAKKHFIKI